MVKIWSVKEGAEPTSGGPLSEISLPQCIELLNLKQSNFYSDFTNTPKFGDMNDPIASFREARLVVVQLETEEAIQNGWQPGFYYLPEISPKEAASILKKAEADNLVAS